MSSDFAGGIKYFPKKCEKCWNPTTGFPRDTKTYLCLRFDRGGGLLSLSDTTLPSLSHTHERVRLTFQLNIKHWNMLIYF